MFIGGRARSFHQPPLASGPPRSDYSSPSLPFAMPAPLDTAGRAPSEGTGNRCGILTRRKVANHREPPGCGKSQWNRTNAFHFFSLTYLRPCAVLRANNCKGLRVARLFFTPGNTGFLGVPRAVFGDFHLARGATRRSWSRTAAEAATSARCRRCGGRVAFGGEAAGCWRRRAVRRGAVAGGVVRGLRCGATLGKV